MAQKPVGTEVVVVAGGVVVAVVEVVSTGVVVVVVTGVGLAVVDWVVVGLASSIGQGLESCLKAVITLVVVALNPVRESYSLHRPVSGSRDSIAQLASALHSPTHVERDSVVTPAPLRTAFTGFSRILHLSR